MQVIENDFLSLPLSLQKLHEIKPLTKRSEIANGKQGGAIRIDYMKSQQTNLCVMQCDGRKLNQENQMNPGHITAYHV